MTGKKQLLGVLTISLVFALALSAVAAGTASALEKCLGIEGQICGQGSSLQKLAQNEVWIPGSAFEVAEYEGTGSGAGRTVFGEETENEKPGGAHAPNTSKDSYVGTDEPLSIKQMENGDLAAGGVYSAKNSEKKGQTLVIPVEQAAVAIIVNEPVKGCLTQISNANLQKVWSGEITKWSELAEGCGTTEITRVVRLDVSGTTFVTKTYLQEILLGNTCEAKKEKGKTWKEFATVAENKNWPKCGTSKAAKEAEKEGGGGEVEEVTKVTGSIGYANLPDARAKFTGANNYTWLKIENQHTKKFENPGAENLNAGVEPTVEKGNANCKETAYTNKPSLTEPTADDNWSEVNGAHPGTGVAAEQNAHYPICTLTYDIALVNYETAKYTGHLKQSELTKKYLGFVVGEATGQKKIAEHHDYRNVEEAVEKFSAKEVELIEEK